MNETARVLSFRLPHLLMCLCVLCGDEGIEKAHVTDHLDGVDKKIADCLINIISSYG